jgi:hypothetical protein
MRSSVQGPPGAPGLRGDRGDKGPQGAQGIPGVTGLIGPTGASGQTICHYLFPITSATTRSELPAPSVGTVSTGWNTYRNVAANPSYISWNNTNQLASTKLHVSWVDHSGINIRTFLSMLKRNDTITVQSKTNHATTQEWTLNADPVAHDNCMEFSVTLTNQASAQPIEHTHALLIFVYSGNALHKANATESRLAALEQRVAALMASAGTS